MLLKLDWEPAFDRICPEVYLKPVLEFLHAKSMSLRSVFLNSVSGRERT